MRHREARILDAASRVTLGEDYVSLPDGVTHFELSGPPDAPLVVLIHRGTACCRRKWFDGAQSVRVSR